MTLNTWLLYSLVALIAIVSPGPAILLAISNGILVGARRGMLASVGNIIGLFVLSAMAMLGLGAILKTSALLFGTLKVVGAAYLVYLGVRQWRSRSSLLAGLQRPEPSKERTAGVIFRQGFFLAVTNPKPILFFTALFPQFISASHALLPQFLILTGTFMAYSFLSLTAYALLARAAKVWLLHERGTLLFNRLSGGAFVALGIGLLGVRASGS